MKRDIKYFVVHCSDTMDYLDIGAEEIRHWHLERGWKDIGYNAVIRRNGDLEWGRDIDKDGDYFEEIGAHARGYNSKSLGICLVGRDRFTDAQMETLGTTLDQWKIRYPKANVVGHRDLNPHKTCPNFNAIKWREEWESSERSTKPLLPQSQLLSLLRRLTSLISEWMKSRKQQ